jgi:hypothetical protein
VLAERPAVLERLRARRNLSTGYNTVHANRRRILTNGRRCRRRGRGSRRLLIGCGRPERQRRPRGCVGDKAGVPRGLPSPCLAYVLRAEPALLQAQSRRRFFEGLRPDRPGLIGAPLQWAVLGVADLRDRSLRRGLEPAAVERHLASCDRRALVGRRDYAALLLLSRLGLRAGEVAALTLENLDWSSGELLVPGKGGRHDRLPLAVRS